jgi:hypothetical protein
MTVGKSVSERKLGSANDSGNHYTGSNRSDSKIVKNGLFRLYTQICCFDRSLLCDI